MQDLLKGTRVIEVATWAAAPGAGGILADLGADVIKVEPAAGDPYRGMGPAGPGGGPQDYSPPFQFDNRNKRSITLDIKNPQARDIVYDLVRGADIFLANLLPSAQEQAGLTYDQLRAINDRLIYTLVTGFGSRGPERDKPGFDHTSFWARAGMMGLLGEADDPPILHRGGDGDHTTSIACAAAILAALLNRERTGQGQFVDVSLLGTGLWVLGIDLSNTLKTKQQPRRNSQRDINNPIWTTYLTKDNRWILLSMAAYEPWFPAVARAIGRPELSDDPKYKTLGTAQTNIKELRQILTEAFAQRTLADWGPILDDNRVAWAPVAEMTEVIVDPQVRAMDYIKAVEHPTYGTIEVPGAPFQFSDIDIRPRGPAPELGQHTEEVLLELDYDWEKIAALRESGALGKV